jgi:uncharacterized membrane protein YgcG
MAACAVQTGFLFWKKPCGQEALGCCRQCGRFVCGRHGEAYGDGTVLCAGCGALAEDSTGTIFPTTSAGVFGAAAASSAAAEAAAAEKWHGGEGDSGGSFDSGGGDSGGGDSGGSGTD